MIRNASDPNMRSVRIDRDWRGIVFKPDAGNVYMLLHVDHHDDAYRWATRRRLAINPVTGAVQIVIVSSIEEPPADAVRTQTGAPDAPAPAAPAPSLFAERSRTHEPRRSAGNAGDGARHHG
jgi:hypothetical protein